MAKFCSECGSGLNLEFGLCPECNKEELERLQSIPNFCMECGSKMDKQRGVCPICSPVEDTATPTDEEPVAAEEAPSEAEENKEVIPETTADEAPAEEETVIEETPTEEPLTEEPAESEKEASKKAKKEKKKLPAALRVILCILLSFVLFVTTSLTLVLYTLRTNLDEKKITELFSSFKGEEIVSIMSGSEKLEDFYDFMNDEHGIEMDDESLGKFIDKSTAKSFLSEKIAGAYKDFTKGKGSLSIEKREIKNLINDNMDLIEKDFGKELNERAVEDIASWISNKKELEIIDFGDFKDDDAALYYTLSLGTSYVAITLLGVLILLFIFLLIRTDAIGAAIGGGIAFTLIGGVTSAAILLGKFASDLWANLAGGFIATALSAVLERSSIICFSVLCIGVISIVVGAIANSISKKRKAQN